MDIFAIFTFFAIVIEGLVEYMKTLCAMFTDKKDVKAFVIQIGALAASIFLCIAAGVDIPKSLGISFAIPYIGEILTGIFASRGANYASDILSKVTSIKVSA